MTKEKFQALASKHEFVKLDDGHVVIGEKVLPIEEFQHEVHKTKGGYISGYGSDSLESHDTVYDDTLLEEEIHHYLDETHH